MKNPLLSLKAYAVLKADLGLTVPHRRSLHQTARAQGLDTVFMAFPEMVQAEKLAKARACLASAWKPFEFWLLSSDRLSQAFPPLAALFNEIAACQKRSGKS